MQIQAHRVSSFGGLPINMFGFNTYLLVNFSREGLTGSKFEPKLLKFEPKLPQSCWLKAEYSRQSPESSHNKLSTLDAC